MKIYVDLELYRIFYVTASKGSISAAAKELYISQPAVSSSIRRLENQLGAPLFVRKPRGVELTKEAALLYEHVKQAFSSLESGEKAFLNALEEKNLEIRINATEILTRYVLLPFLKSFSEKYPKIKIKLSSRGTPEAISLLKNGELDIALPTLPCHEASNLNLKEFFTFHDCFVAGSNFTELKGRTLSLSELTKYPILVLQEGMNSRFFIDKLCKAHNVSLDPHMEVESIDTLIRCAQSGCGISFIIKEFAEKKISDGELFEIPIKEKIDCRTIGIATANGTLEPHIQLFIDELLENNEPLSE